MAGLAERQVGAVLRWVQKPDWEQVSMLVVGCALVAGMLQEIGCSEYGKT